MGGGRKLKTGQLRKTLAPRFCICQPINHFSAALSEGLDSTEPGIYAALSKYSKVSRTKLQYASVFLRGLLVRGSHFLDSYGPDVRVRSSQPQVQAGPVAEPFFSIRQPCLVSAYQDPADSA